MELDVLDRPEKALMKRLRSLRNRLSKGTVPAKLYAAAVFAYFTVFWFRVLARAPGGDLIAFHPGLYSDWMFHFSLGSYMSINRLVPAFHPLVYGVPLKYHFLSDTLAALVHRAGVPFFASFTLTAWAFSLFFAAALFWFFLSLLRSQNRAVLASLLFFLSGGTGFIEAIRTALRSHIMIRATDIKDLHIYWKSVIDTLIIPQRPFALGVPAALTGLLLIWRWMKGGPVRWMAAAGVLLGILPITHAHSFLACFLILLFWLAADVEERRADIFRTRWKGWAALVAVTALIALPLIFTYILSKNASALKWRWSPGWYAGTTEMNWIGFWWRNLAFLPVLAAAGGFLAVRNRLFGRGRKTFLIIAPFFLIFILGNLFNVQAWLWDNTKLLAWSAIGFAGLAAYAAGETWRRRAVRPVIAGIIAVSCLSGGWDAVRLLRHKPNRVVLFTDEELQLAEWAKVKTGDRTVWLTSEKPNHWIPTLTGRRILMTYNGWLWSHGLNSGPLKKDVGRMFGDPAESADLYRSYGIDYVVLDRQAKDEFGADEEALNDRFVVVKKTPHYTVYDVKAGAYKTPVPATIPRLDGKRNAPGRTSPGLRRRVFDNPRFEGNPVRTGVQSTPLDFRYDYLQDRPFPSPVSMEFDGWLRADKDGIYAFYLESDDGSALWLDGTLIVDNGGMHEVREKTGKADLARGWHAIRITYADQGGGAILKLYWKPPGGVREAVPANAWRR